MKIVYAMLAILLLATNANASDAWQMSKGIFYEQPVCQNTLPPSVSVQKYNEQITRRNYDTIYQADFAISSQAGSWDCVDSRGRYHTKQDFFAWQASGGVLTDITPVGSKPYSVMRWSGVIRNGSNHFVRANVGDSLGSLVGQTITLQGAPDNTVAAPSNLAVTFNGTAYTLSWTDNSSNEQGFKLEGGLDGVNWREVGNYSTNRTQITGSIASSPPGAIVYFRIRAYNGTEYSSYSNTLKMVVPDNAGATIKVTSATPTTATLDKEVIFQVNGDNLPSTLALWVDQCENLRALGGSSVSRSFACTPRYSAGLKQAQVKDRAGGKLLHSFTVNVTAPVPQIASVSPTSAILGEKLTATVAGTNLPTTLTLWVDQCSNMMALGGTSTSRSFSCTPSYSTGSKSAQVKDATGGKLLHSFNVNVVAAPKVTSASPTSATLNQPVTFTINGTNLPSTLALWVDQCNNMKALGGSTTSRSFSCTPSYSAGSKSAQVKDASGGKLLYSFNVNVAAPPQVTSVSPTSAALNQLVNFTVNGTNLPSTLALWVDQCNNMKALGGSTTSRSFSCTPSYSAGSKTAQVKDASGGKLLYSFNVNVVAPPQVTSVSPTTATLNKAVTFTVQGTNLPSTLTLWVDQCESMRALGGSTTSRSFSCTPKYSKGYKSAILKDKSGGSTLRSFSLYVR